MSVVNVIFNELPKEAWIKWLIRKINRTDRENEHVVFGLNGKVWVVKRGATVDVDECLLPILDKRPNTHGYRLVI